MIGLQLIDELITLAYCTYLSYIRPSITSLIMKKDVIALIFLVLQVGIQAQDDLKDRAQQVARDYYTGKDESANLGFLAFMNKLEGGITYFNLIGKDARSMHLKPDIGYFIGVGTTLGSQKFEVNIEIGYTQNNLTQDLTKFPKVPEANENGFYKDSLLWLSSRSIGKLRMHSVPLSLLFRHKILNKSVFLPNIFYGISGNVNFSKGGLVISRKSSAGVEYNGILAGFGEESSYNSSCLKLFNFDAILGLGVDVVKHVGGTYMKIVGIECRYSLGLGTIYKKPGDSSNSILNEKKKLRPGLFTFGLVFYYGDMINGSSFD